MVVAYCKVISESIGKTIGVKVICIFSVLLGALERSLNAFNFKIINSALPIFRQVITKRYRRIIVGSFKSAFFKHSFAVYISGSGTVIKYYFNVYGFFLPGNSRVRGGTFLLYIEEIQILPRLSRVS